MSDGTLVDQVGQLYDAYKGGQYDYDPALKARVYGKLQSYKELLSAQLGSRGSQDQQFLSSMAHGVAEGATGAVVAAVNAPNRLASAIAGVNPKTMAMMVRGPSARPLEQSDLGVTPNNDTSYGAELGRGLGTAGVMLPLAFLGPGAVAAGGATVGGSQNLAEAQNAGASQGAQLIHGAVGAGAGALTSLGPLGRIGEEAGPVLKGALRGAAEGAGITAVQQGANAVSARATGVNTEAGMNWTQVAAGGTVGAGLGAAGAAFGPKPVVAEKAPSETVAEKSPAEVAPETKAPTSEEVAPAVQGEAPLVGYSVQTDDGVQLSAPSDARRYLLDKFSRIGQVESEQAAHVGKQNEKSMETAFALLPAKERAQFREIQDSMKGAAKVVAKAGIHVEDQPGKPGYNRYLEALGTSKRFEAFGKTGIDPEQAAAIVNEAESGPAADAYKNLRQINRTRNEAVARVLVDSGLVSPEHMAAMQEKYGPDYAPLKDFEGVAGVQGQRMSVRAQTLKAAQGRETEASSILERSHADWADLVHQGEVNKAYLSAADWIKANPDEGLWKVTPDRAEAESFSKDVIRYKRNGTDEFMAIRDPAFAEALRQTEPSTLPTFVRPFAKVTRTIGDLSTSHNPIFPFLNLPKDWGMARISLEVEHGKPIAKAATRPKHVFESIASSWNRDAGFVEAEKAGAFTGYARRESLADLVQQTEKTIQAHGKEGKLRTAYEAVRRVNDAVETGMRYSVYRAMREAGKSKDEAALGAKRATVDFDQRGVAASGINAVWAFSQANINGTHRFVKLATTTPAGRMMAAKIVATGVAMGAVNRAILGDKWDQYSDAVKDRYFIIPTGGKHDIFIPMPWGFSTLFHAGTILADIAAGRKKTEAASAIGTSLLQQANPLSGSTFMQVISPTVMDPFVMVAENKDFSGRRIRPDKPGPESEKFYPNVSPLALSAAREANKLTGGNQFRSGVVDVSPEDIETITSQMGGGLGRVLAQAFKDVTNGVTGTPLEMRDIPLLGSFLRTPNVSGYVGKKYAEAKQEANVQYQEARGGLGVGPQAGDRRGFNVTDRAINKLRSIRTDKNAADVDAMIERLRRGMLER